MEKSEETKDSLAFYLKGSKNKSLPLTQRMQLIRRAYKNITTSTADSLSLAVMLQKGNIHYSKREKDSALYYDRLVFDSAFANLMYPIAGKTAFHLALHFNAANQYDSAFFYHNVSKSQYLRINDSAEVGRRLLSMGIIQKNQGDFFGSKETITDALVFLETMNDTKYVSSAYNVLATNYRKLSSLNQAKKYYGLAIENTPSSKDAYLYKNNQAVVLIEQKKYAKAVILLKEILNDDQIRSDTLAYARALDNYGYAKWLHTDEDTSRELRMALNTRQKMNDSRGVVASAAHLTTYYRTKNRSKAIRYAELGMTAAKTIGSLSGQVEATQRLVQLKPLDIALKNRYIGLKDSMFQKTLNVKSQFAKMRYNDIRQRETMLKLQEETQIAEQRAASQELNAAQRLRQLWGSVVALVVVLSFLVVLFVQHRKILRLNATLDLLNTDIRHRKSNDYQRVLSELRKIGFDSVSAIENMLYASMAVDDLLYGAKGKTVNLKHHLETVLADKRTALNMAAQGIMMKLDIPNLVLQGESASKLTFIISELIMNSVKHSDTNFETTITLRVESIKNNLLVTYSDTNKEVSESQLNTSKKLGWKIITQFTEQLDGTIEVVRKKQGNMFKLAIPLE
ncbi:MAG: hypothetical protein Mars2KO_05110 [Maribacter sp.]